MPSDSTRGSDPRLNYWQFTGDGEPSSGKIQRYQTFSTEHLLVLEHY